MAFYCLIVGFQNSTFLMFIRGGEINDQFQACILSDSDTKKYIWGGQMKAVV